MVASKMGLVTVTTVAIVVLGTGPGVQALQAPPALRDVSPAENKPQVALEGENSAPPEVMPSATLQPFADRAWYAVFSPDGKSLVTGRNLDGTIKIYDVATSQVVATLAGEARTSFGCAAFSPDGKTLVTSGGAVVLVWDFAGRKRLARFQAHVKGVRSLAFSPDGKSLASGSDDMTVRLWDMNTGKQRPAVQTLTEPVFSVAFSPDGKTLAIGTGDYRVAGDPEIRLYDYDGVDSLKERIQMAAGRRGPVWSLAFSPDGQTLVSSSPDPMLMLWDASSGRKREELPVAERRSTRGLAFSPDGRTLAAGLSDLGNVAVFQFAARRRIATLRGSNEHLFTVAISPDGKTLAGASKDGTVKFWDLAKSLPERP